MSTGSPTAYLLWAILSCIFLTFLALHLWLYDKFNCLRWNSGRQPGAFKRIMTYSYLGTVPLIIVFSTVMSVAGFREGYIHIPFTGRIEPKPLSHWNSTHQGWILPLNFALSFAWALEIVTHLEELMFWLFLQAQGPGKREWFQSWEFRTWCLGSLFAIVGMPLVVALVRRSFDTITAWIFLVGSSASSLTTLAFIYVLLRFPDFIRQVKEGGADPDVVIRLATFFNLNRIRVVFRFLFTVPLLMIGCDAIVAPYPIVGGPFAIDFLLMTGAIGCFVSSAITLLVFFPRSIAREEGYRAKAATPQQSTEAQLPKYIQEPHPGFVLDPYPQHISSYDFDSNAYKANYPHGYPPGSQGSPDTRDHFHLQSSPRLFPNPTPISPSFSYQGSYYPNHLSDVDHGALADEDEGSDESSPEYESEIDQDSFVDSPASPSAYPTYMMQPIQNHDPRYPQPLPSSADVRQHEIHSHSQPQSPALLHSPQSQFGSGAHPSQPSNHDRTNTNMRQGSSRTAVVRPTSNGRSEDTVWDQPAQSPQPATHTQRGSTATTGTTLTSGHAVHAVQMHPSLPPRRRDVHAHSHTRNPGAPGGTAPPNEAWTRRRRHSDPSVVSAKDAVTAQASGAAPNVGGEANPTRSGPGRPIDERPARDRGSLLHPYLMNFTSPIDLLDGTPSLSTRPSGSNVHPSRMV